MTEFLTGGTAQGAATCLQLMRHDCEPPVFHGWKVPMDERALYGHTTARCRRCGVVAEVGMRIAMDQDTPETRAWQERHGFVRIAQLMADPIPDT